MEEKTEGILLRSIPYLGSKKILKVLTPEHGLISLICKTKSQPSPFCIAEWVFRKTNKEIHPLQDFTLLDPLLELRQDYAVLSTAGLLAQDLLHTQLPGKPAPFTLASAYLKKLPLNPTTLLASFRLKLLIHEGLFSPEEPIFTPTEWEIVLSLAFGKQFSSILEHKAVPFAKIETLFQERF